MLPLDAALRPQVHSRPGGRPGCWRLSGAARCAVPTPAIRRSGAGVRATPGCRACIELIPIGFASENQKRNKRLRTSSYTSKTEIYRAGSTRLRLVKPEITRKAELRSAFQNATALAVFERGQSRAQKRSDGFRGDPRTPLKSAHMTHGSPWARSSANYLINMD